LKIADFGFSTALAGKDGSGLLKTVLGTESYMAPEIHSHEKYSGTAVDIFASGIILFIMYTGHPPFVKADHKSDAYYKCLCTNRHSAFWTAHSKNKPGKMDFFSPELLNLFNSLFA
jgi:serine/threonine protein kinase